MEESGAPDDIVAAARLMEGEGFDPVAVGWDRGMEEEEERVPVEEEGEGEFLPVGRKMRKRAGRDEEEEDLDLGESEFFYIFFSKKITKNIIVTSERGVKRQKP